MSLRGALSPAWKGDEVGYFALHCWVAANFDKTHACEECGRDDAPTEFASIGHSYTRERKDWRELCRKCHRRMDAKTHCKRGHAFDEANTCQRKDGSRLCRTCANDYARRRRADRSV